MNLVPLVLRALQLLFAIILLGMTGYLVNTTTSVSYYGYRSRSPSEVAFMLFTSVWTLGFALVLCRLNGITGSWDADSDPNMPVPALPYLALGPRFLPASANKKVIHLAVDALTALFWFAGFIALAAWYGGNDGCTLTVCQVVVATCVFGAFEWYVGILFAPPNAKKWVQMLPKCRFWLTLAAARTGSFSPPPPS
ncbi:MAG: hypothetical protein LQ348_000332 [Seirophora lacunosa]|nr:MAG: hypothetical protein LQ348_000332 [Seirophora lacunosa]